MAEPIYFPILKWKQGEQKALQECMPTTKAVILPILELPPLPQNYVEDPVPTKTCNKHLEKFGSTLQKSWQPNDGPVCIDAKFINEAWLSQNDIHPVINSIRQARDIGISAIPVTSPRRMQSYQEAVKEVLKDELTIRISVTDLANGTQQLEHCLNYFALPPNKVDCILDLGDINPIHRDAFQFTATALLANIPYCNEWRNLILTGTSFPTDMSGFEREGVSSIERSEWLIWNNIRNLNQGRLPKFSDYGISSADLGLGVDPRFMNPSASVRYTGDDDYFIFKGRGLRTHPDGYEQNHTLSEWVVRHHCYSGPNFSWGDDYINRCASRSCGPGNPTTWRQVGTNHHIEKVVNQISSLPAF